MDKKRRRGVLIVLLALTVVSFFRINGHEIVRPVLFLTVFIIGALSAALILDFRDKRHSAKDDADKLI